MLSPSQIYFARLTEEEEEVENENGQQQQLPREINRVLLRSEFIASLRCRNREMAEY